ncbi:hypothetical protein [Dactylosporangium sp. CA-139066]|uniref:hypothetical protein n=1 Tax=Dactylosporangium sp. CA-139066 TaxID=3239930 RepID=UPI003D93B8B3
MSPRTRGDALEALLFVRRNHADNPQAVTAFVDARRELADWAAATARTPHGRAVAHALRFAADAATRALADLQEIAA